MQYLCVREHLPLLAVTLPAFCPLASKFLLAKIFFILNILSSEYPHGWLLFQSLSIAFPGQLQHRDDRKSDIRNPNAEYSHHPRSGACTILAPLLDIPFWVGGRKVPSQREDCRCRGLQWYRERASSTKYVCSYSSRVKERVIALTFLIHSWVFWFRQQRAPGNKITNYEEGIKKISAFSSVSTLYALWRTAC